MVVEPLLHWLADCCRKTVLEEKWLIVDDLQSGQAWKDRLVRCGNSHLNLHAKTLRNLAFSLAATQLADSERIVVSDGVARMVVQSIVGELKEKDELEYFGTACSLAGLSKLLARSISQLRLADVDAQTLTEDCCESPAKARDLAKIMRAYKDGLDARRMADYADCLRLATTNMDTGDYTLPSGLRVIIPEELPLGTLEQRFLKVIQSRACVCRPETTFTPAAVRETLADPLSEGTINLAHFSGMGEVNEVRGVFQRILSRHNSTPRLDDVEIIYTDYRSYVPLILESLIKWTPSCDADNESLPSIDNLPVTFAEGVACIYSRPGRLLRSWVRWAQSGHSQSQAVQILREGLLVRPPQADTVGYSRLANTLRRLPIGFGIERYLEQLRHEIHAAQQLRADSEARGNVENFSNVSEPNGSIRDFGLSALQSVLTMFTPLVALAPVAGDDAQTVLQKAHALLSNHARADNKLDQMARGKLLEEIQAMMATLNRLPELEWDAWQWLQELPLQSHLLASNSRPGCLHVAPLRQGGLTGRDQVFVIGLDDRKDARAVAADPVLLDRERQRISPDLCTSASVQLSQQASLERVLHRLNGVREVRLCLSYSARDLSNDQIGHPSSKLLQLIGCAIITNRTDNHHKSSGTHVDQPISFISSLEDEHLDGLDAQLASLLSQDSATERQRLLLTCAPHAALWNQVRALDNDVQLNAFDGLVPQAGADMQQGMLNECMSPSRFETFGTCPRKFFFQYGLRITPPEEWIVVSDRWLNPLQFGSLVHELFEDFLRGHTQRDLVPDESRDLEPLKRLLQEKLDRLRQQIPPTGEDAYRKQRDELHDICEIFLQKESQYCAQYGARPWVVEVSLGASARTKPDRPKEAQSHLDCKEPVELRLSDGRTFRLAGRIDRIDRLQANGSESFAIWDYKSGSDFGFDADNPFAQGRKLQPYLYMSMLRHRIERLGKPAEAVVSFGYFFPSPQCEGRRLQWSYAQLSRGDEVVRHICDLVTAGAFVATTDRADCAYCDYTSVCGEAQIVTAHSMMKSVAAVNTVLNPWRMLRELPTMLPSPLAPDPFPRNGARGAE